MTLGTGPAPAFVRACERFIALCEDTGGDDLDRMHRLLDELTAIHFLVVRLPPREAESDLPGAGFPFKATRRKIANAFPELGRYSVCDDPLGMEGTPSTARRDAHDDLTRLHEALGDGLDLWRRGMRRDAVHHWAETFRTKWRLELVHLLALLHDVLA